MNPKQARPDETPFLTHPISQGDQRRVPPGAAARRRLRQFTWAGVTASFLGSMLLAGGCSGEDAEDDSGPDSDGADAGGGETGNSGGTSGAGVGGTGTGGLEPVDDPDFWDRTNIPAPQNVLVFKFLNRTNGEFSDDEVFWSFKNDTIDEVHSIAEVPTFDMPANNSGRMYFYICEHGDSACLADPRSSKYYDFIEHTIGENQYNGNTTRVDAFGLKIAMLLHAEDGWEEQVGENQATFLEPREQTFQAFLDFVPEEYDSCAMEPHAPYRIVEPGACGFNTDQAHADYYESFIDEMWANNALTVDRPTANANGLGAYPDLSAAIYRHVGSEAGTFSPDGTLLKQEMWDDPSTFYQAAPAHYYAAFWHARGIDGKAYGFPYDDVGSYSTYVSRSDPDYLLIAIGW